MTHTYNTRFQAKQQAEQQSQVEQQSQAEQQIPVQEHSTFAQPPTEVDPIRMRHCYATRFERKRIREVVIHRDINVVSDLLHNANAAGSTRERLKTCIDIYKYLLRHQMLLRVKLFRDVVWRKIDELERECYEHVIRINSIENQEEFKKNRAMRKYTYKLVNIMNEVRDVIRV
jgi:hypothetical protein